MLIDVAAPGPYAVLGETRDDAAGEAFDKSAKLLGLPYPGGPELARLAATGNAGRFDFPRPMLDRAGLEFSFSGLKTAVSLAVSDRQQRTGRARRADARRHRRRRAGGHRRHAGRQDAARARANRLRVPGGRGRRGREPALRARLDAAAARQGAKVFYPRIEFCTDNAAMIAVAGMARLKAGSHEIHGDPRAGDIGRLKNWGPLKNWDRSPSGNWLDEEDSINGA